MQYYDFYLKYFPDLKPIPKQNVNCAFHDDKTPSLSLDLDTGKWFCHACQKGGDVFQFYMDYHKVSFPKAKAAILGSERMDILSNAEVIFANNLLITSEHLLKAVKIKRGWDDSIIRKFKLGWINNFITIPIYDKDNNLINIRKYDLFHKTKQKFRNVKGHGGITLFPIENLGKETIILFAGEPDTILANQLGLPGITFTGGEGSFNRALLPLFKDKKVYICYDIDDIGKKSAKILGQNLVSHAKETFIIHLPKEIFPKELKNADFTDLFFSSLDKGKQFNTIWNQLVSLAEKVEKEEEEEEEYIKTTFHEATKSEFFGKNIYFKAHVVGKGVASYAAPEKATLTCNFECGDSCKGCPLFFSGGTTDVKIDLIDSLELINCSNEEQRRKLKRISGIYQKCNFYKVKATIRSIEEIIICPEIDINLMEQQFVTRKVFTVSDNLVTNKIYSFYGKTINDPRSQQLTNIFPRQKPEIADLYNFELSEEQKTALKIFNPIENNPRSIAQKLKDIYTDFTFNIKDQEKIIKREDLMFCCDLVFFSVLSFNFLNAKVTKGWTEVLILGDERTGKTKTVQKLISHYKAGDYRTLEGASIPGLIGGVAQLGNEKFFGWGALPLNDGHLVVLDEGNALDKEGWANLSSIRDTGIAERTVVGSTRKTLARVRIIVLSNPRSYGKRIEHYTSGVEAIKDLIGKNEDIARFDFAIIITQKDIDPHILNREESYHHTVEHIYTSELNSWLLQWAWSRKPHHIVFTNEGKRKILEKAEAMAEKYTDTIPLVQRSVQRIRLAKLCVALACRMFSTENGINVMVRPEHVEVVVSFLENIYDSKYFGYDNYSIISKKDQTIQKANEVKAYIMGLSNPKRFVEKILAAREILFEDIMDYTDQDRESAKAFKRFLVEHNCIKRIKSWYVLQPQFVSLLKKLEDHYRKGGLM